MSVSVQLLMVLVVEILIHLISAGLVKEQIYIHLGYLLLSFQLLFEIVNSLIDMVQVEHLILSILVIHEIEALCPVYPIPSQVGVGLEVDCMAIWNWLRGKFRRC